MTPVFRDNLLRIAMLPDKGYATDLARAYNAWLAERWLARDATYRGALMAAPQDPEATAREIQRYQRARHGRRVPDRRPERWGGGPLREGKITGPLITAAEAGWKPDWVKEGEILLCPWHSLEFDITSGACLAYPGRRIRTYPAKVVDGRILVIL